MNIKATLRKWLKTLGMVLAALLIVAVGEALPPLRALEAWMAPHRAQLAWITGWFTFAGFCLFMGAAIYRTVMGSRSLTHEEATEHFKSVKDGLNAPYAYRGSKYVVPDQAVGGEFHDEFTFAEIKDAWRRQLWRTDPVWRGFFLMAAGASLMSVGIISTIFVLSPAGLKLVIAGAFLYAAFRTVHGFLKA